MTKSLWKLLNEYRIIVPILQRDYAQGRETGKVPKIRDNLLHAICKAIRGGCQPLTLDFIYGYNKSGEDDIERFYPLDGQQRLTTLFLLHWYVAAKEGHLAEASPVLSRFTYETRHSSEVFCNELVKYQPESFGGSVRENIINQSWFFSAWMHDPTIQSMLTMLEALEMKLDEYQLHNVWEALTGESSCIVFNLLSMKDLGLHDDLYIKMNSRGKELTEFEYFKIRISEDFKREHFEEFRQKIDREWSDLFWNCYKEEGSKDTSDGRIDIAQKVDAAFLRFFRYVTDMIAFRRGLDEQKSNDEMVYFKKVYADPENVTTLFSILDLFSQLYINQSEFFASVFYVEEKDYSADKNRLFFSSPNVDLFRKCCDVYDTAQRINPFSIGEQLLLYGCILHLQKQTPYFDVRARKLRNLISNSEDNLRKEYVPELMHTVEKLILFDDLSADERFNKNQISEEGEKTSFLNKCPQLTETLRKLEDHSLLRGCLAVFSYDNKLSDYSEAFYRVFHPDCDYLTISRAMFVYGDYSQQTNWARLLGNKNEGTWRELFTPSQMRSDFDKTHQVLYQLLDALIQKPSLTIEEMIACYLETFDQEPQKEKDWRYYFIKYELFHYHTDGYYYWADRYRMYECFMLRRKTRGGYHWNPFLCAVKYQSDYKLSFRDDYGGLLVFVHGDAVIHITGHQLGYVLTGSSEEGKALVKIGIDQGWLDVKQIWTVEQSKTGFDTEDRIEAGIRMIKRLEETCGN